MNYRMAFGKASNARKAGIERLTKLVGEVKASFTIPRQRINHLRFSLNIS